MELYKRVLITGGAGYCGTSLVPQLLESGYEVTVYDTLFFTADFLPLDDKKLRVIKGDIRDVKAFSKALVNQDAVVNLACISNDASFELDEALSTSVNYDAFEPMVKAAKKAGIKRFIHASSSSVYGVSDKLNVTEDHPLVPLTLYNKYKGMSEPLLLRHTDEKFHGVIFRPATVCGYSPRQRLDLSVNILTNLAYHTQKITVFGGSQMRPNLNIKDYCAVVQLLLESETTLIANQIFNVGNENLTISQIAKLVKLVIEENFPAKSPISIEVTNSDDLRSYHINSDKINHMLGFTPKFTIKDAILDLCMAFNSNKLENSLTDDIYFNVKRIKNLNIK